ncbi:hypothetical protein I603_1405 [Erythrobacter dokdonensis DSW-74]|uniref:Uncharacterized protein n=1 Tax=Erythrobacter dokdonensis DSW-74 TaxID=1300349 RepID=A0A1A7BHT6_9SPHN|nr:hypothetical protein I603_1405 [Erythrobacter dokdonensis DSW-74]
MPQSVPRISTGHKTCVLILFYTGRSTAPPTGCPQGGPQAALLSPPDPLRKALALQRLRPLLPLRALPGSHQCLGVRFEPNH